MGRTLFEKVWDSHVVTHDEGRPDLLYVEALAAPDTIDTMPEKTLLAFADHGKVKEAMREDGSCHCEKQGNG